jgi:uncharacterized repeat protein (TIGR01451 family)
LFVPSKLGAAHIDVRLSRYHQRLITGFNVSQPSWVEMLKVVPCIAIFQFMTLRSHLILSVLILLCAGLHAQAPQSFHLYPSGDRPSGDTPGDVVGLPDGGFYYGLTDWEDAEWPDYFTAIQIVRADSLGRDVWRKVLTDSLTISLEDGSATSSGGSLWSGERGDRGYAFALDASGNVLWTWEHDSMWVSRITHSRQTLDGGFVLSGFLTGFPRRAMLVKLDALGSEEWRWYSDETWDSPWNANEGTVVQLQDSAYAVSSLENLPSWDSIQVFKVSTSGNTVWKTSLRRHTGAYWNKRRMFVLPSGNIVMAEREWDSYPVLNGFWTLYEMDPSTGSLVNTTVLDTAVYGVQQSLVLMEDGGWTLGIANSYLGNPQYPEITRLNPDLSIAWHRDYKEFAMLFSDSFQTIYNLDAADDRIFLSVISQYPGPTGVYCLSGDSVFPYKSIGGKVYLDLDEDVTISAGDTILSDVMILRNGIPAAGSFQEGQFQVFDFREDTLVLTGGEKLFHELIHPPGGSYTVVPSMDTVLDTFHFLYSRIPGIYEVELKMTIPPANVALPAGVYMSIRNNGTEAVDSAIVTFQIDSGLVYDTCLLEPIYLDSQSVQWLLPDLAPGEEYLLTPFFHTPDSLLVFCDSAWVDIPYTDSIPANNWAVACWPTLTSFDPNNVTVRIPETTPWAFTQDLAEIGYSPDTLEYMIQFQNTGDTYAVNVRIEDSLDARLDQSSVEVIDMSHDGTLEELSPGRIGFDFPMILLPDSGLSYEESIGFVHYKVALNSPLDTTDVLVNRAAIYFDFNAPVVTGPASVIWTAEQDPGVMDTVSGLHNLHQSVQVYPNPANDRVTIGFGHSVQRTLDCRVLDVNGRLMDFIQVPPGARSMVLDVRGLPNGLYFIQLDHMEAIPLEVAH